MDQNCFDNVSYGTRQVWALKGTNNDSQQILKWLDGIKQSIDKKYVRFFCMDIVHITYEY